MRFWYNHCYHFTCFVSLSFGMSVGNRSAYFSTPSCFPNSPLSLSLSSFSIPLDYSPIFLYSTTPSASLHFPSHFLSSLSSFILSLTTLLPPFSLFFPMPLTLLLSPSPFLRPFPLLASSHVTITATCQHRGVSHAVRRVSLCRQVCSQNTQLFLPFLGLGKFSGQAVGSMNKLSY